MRRWALIAVVAGCAEDVPEPPAILVPTTLRAPVDNVVFDSGDGLIFSDGIQLIRASATIIAPIPGSEPLALAPSFGVDRDGELLVGGQTTNLVRLTATGAITTIGPAAPAVPFFAPVGTPGGRYHILGRAPFGPFVLSADATTWLTGPDLSLTLRAADGTLFAVRDHAIVRFAADDSITVLADCSFAGASCGLLGGVDAAGLLYMGVPAAGEIATIDPVGAVDELDLPSELVLVDVRATPQMVVVLAKNPLRDNELTVWLVSDGGFQRIAQVNDATRLLADHGGNVYVLTAGRLDVVFLVR
jgi:hypothetical protein